MFGVDSDDGFEEDAPRRVDEDTGPAKVERRLEKWDALARTLSDDDDDQTKKDAKDAAAAYARLVEVCGGGPNDWEVVHERVAVREQPSTAAPLLGMRRKGAIISVEHAREGLWLKLAGEEGWMLAHGRRSHHVVGEKLWSLRSSCADRRSRVHRIAPRRTGGRRR